MTIKNKLFNKKYSNKEIILFISFCFLSSIIVTFPLFSKDIYVGYDLTFHLNRIVGIRDAFLDHQILPKIYPYTNNGFGYASPLFYCDLYLYPFAFLYYLGLPLVICYKIMIFSFVLLTSIIVFFISLKAFENKCTKYLSTILYLFCNYYLFDIYARAALGEVFAFCFIPLVIYSIYLVLIKNQDNFIMLGFSFSLLLMSHIISFVLFCFLFFVLFVVFIVSEKSKDIKIETTKTILKGVFVALMLSLWYLLPMLEQFLDQTFWVNSINNSYNLSNSIQSFKSFVYPFARLDTVHDNYGIYGIFNIVGMGVMLVILLLPSIKNSINNSPFSLTLLIIISLCILLISGILPSFKFMTFLQFLYRLYILVFPLSIVLISSWFNKKDNNIQKLIILFSVIFSIINICVLNKDIKLSNKKINNLEFSSIIFDKDGISKDYNEKQMGGAEYLPITLYTNYLTDSTFIKEIDQQNNAIDIIYNFKRNFSKISFNTSFNEQKTIMLPLTYYKGYKLYKIVDGNRIPINCFSTDKFKQVTFIADAGNNNYLCLYKGTFIQRISLVFSILSAIVIIMYEIKYERDVY